MGNVISLTEPAEFATKLWAAVTPDRRWPTKDVEPGSKSGNDGGGRRRAKMLIKGVATPVVDANQIILISVGEEIQPYVLHGESEMRCEGVVMGFEG